MFLSPQFRQSFHNTLSSIAYHYNLAGSPTYFLVKRKVDKTEPLQRNKSSSADLVSSPCQNSCGHLVGFMLRRERSLFRGRHDIAHGILLCPRSPSGLPYRCIASSPVPVPSSSGCTFLTERRCHGEESEQSTYGVCRCGVTFRSIITERDISMPATITAWYGSSGMLVYCWLSAKIASLLIRALIA